MIISLSAPSCANTVEVCEVDVVYVKLVASQPANQQLAWGRLEVIPKWHPI